MDPAEIHPLVDTDLREICRVRAGPAAHEIESVVLEQRLRWFVLDNPFRLEDVPPGWVLRTQGGTIVGSLLCVPQRFVDAAGHAFTLLLSSGYFVDPAYRSVGTDLFNRYLELGSAHPLLTTAATGRQGETWKQAGGSPVAGTSREWFGVLNWAPVAEEITGRRTKLSGLSRLAAAFVAPLAPFADALKLPAAYSHLDLIYDSDDIPAPSETADSAIRGVRDHTFVKWRFFQSPDYDIDVLRFTPEYGGPPSAVVVKHTTRGYRQQIRTLVVLDVWGPAVSADVVAAHLAARYRDRCDAIVFGCQGPEAETDLARAGFKPREFETPAAWIVDPADLLGGHPLRLSLADGDAVL